MVPGRYMTHDTQGVRPWVSLRPHADVRLPGAEPPRACRFPRRAFAFPGEKCHPAASLETFQTRGGEAATGPLTTQVTIKDVARVAGVAVGTVSNHLNATAPVASSTARKIDRAIGRLGYRVHMGARSLRSHRTQSAGLVLPNISNPFYAEIARAIEFALWQHGFQTLLCDSGGDADRERKHVETLARRRVDGILMIRSGERSAAVRMLEDLDIPVVFVDRGAKGKPSVTSDNRLGGELVARHLIELGHRRIALLQGENTVGNVRQRTRGFQAELARHDVSIDPRCVVSGPQAVELGYEVERLVKLTPRPTAIFATNDIVAIGAWRRLLELGFRVPQDLSLVGFDDIELSKLLFPPLTTVRQEKEAMGQQAAAVFLRLVEGKALEERELVIAPQLMVRGSTAAVRGAAPLPERASTRSTRSKGDE